MKTEDLIVELARSAGPVAPLASPIARFARWAAAFGVFAAAAVVIAGGRPTLRGDLSNPAFLTLAAVTIATAWLSAVAALRSSVPGSEGPTAERALPAAGAIAWTMLLAGLLISGGNAAGRLLAFPVHAGCIFNIFVLGLLPWLGLLKMIRDAAPLNLGRSAALAALASLSLAAAAVQFICPIDDPAHHLDGHLLPVIAFAFVGAAIGVRWLGGAPSAK